MKKGIVCLCLLGWMVSPLFAQVRKHDTLPLGKIVERQIAEAQKERLKSYYNDLETALLCEAWNSCAKWAFEQYVKDQTFTVTKAKLRTERIVYRHRVTKEKRLYIQATVQDRTINMLFVSPFSSGRTRPYRPISKFPSFK